MKSFCVLIFCICFGWGFSQKITDTGGCEKEKMSDSILYQKLKEESKSIDYDKLTRKIINDIDISKLPSENLIIFYNDKVTRNPFDNEPCFCCFEMLSEHPFYNEVVFWTPKNIKAIVKKLKKNIIPQNRLANKFIYDLPNLKPQSIYERKTAFKKLVTDVRKQRKGVYQDINFNHLIKEEKFFYYAYNGESLMLNSTSSQLGTTKNFNTLELLFSNELYKKINVILTYDDNYEGRIHKTYQYINKDWQLVNESVEE